MKAIPDTRTRIISAAADLFYGDGIRAVSMDAVAERAGVTKRTLYYHFDSKDELVGAYLEERDQPNLERFRRWFERAEGDIGDRVMAVFAGLARAAANRKWNGCGFLRTSAELANMPGHPALRAARAHKKRVEAWFSEECQKAGCGEPEALGKTLMLLMDGGFATVLMHRDPAYFVAAGQTAAHLVRQAAGLEAGTAIAAAP
ncbi:TetR/AcrR family transcriptional regulator [Gellertiella hungarica]|uniref:AcrR family transcriptional regulator n=1 Tax=Gellertiella hungarica TaxID=1572859 RepID=A0A7W6J4T0_9HYPH|nr:TetR/AcrR family transcriptional regulator [Gellertiella hungarica]MBB4064799.1 AcrR family transcriptional regulator [Gellertiella hungarica]